MNKSKIFKILGENIGGYVYDFMVIFLKKITVPNKSIKNKI